MFLYSSISNLVAHAKRTTRFPWTAKRHSRRRPRRLGLEPLEDRTPLSGWFLSMNHDPEGDMPRKAAFTPDGESVLVVHRDTDNVMVFDAETRTVTATVPVGRRPVDVAVSPDGNYAVVPNLDANTVTVVDLPSRSVAAHVPITGSQPYRVHVTSDSQHAVVGVINDGEDSSFSVIDLTTLTEARTFSSAPQGTIGFWGNPETGVSDDTYTRFAVSPDNTTIVLPDRDAGRVVLYDLNLETMLASLPMAARPSGVDISPDGAIAVVSHEFPARAVSVLDLNEPFEVTTHELDHVPSGQMVRVTPDASHAIVGLSNSVLFVDLATGASSEPISTGSVGDIVFSYDGQFAFVSSFQARVIDIATQTIVRTLTVGPSYDAAASPVDYRAVALNNRFREDVHFYNIQGAAGSVEGRVSSGVWPEGDATRSLAISPDGQTLVAGNPVSSNVSIVDLESGSIRAYLDTGDRIKELGVTPDGSHAVVANQDSNTVSIIDLATDAVVATLHVPTRPTAVAMGLDSQWAYVTSTGGTQRLHFIQLAGAASSVVGTLDTGRMGQSNDYTFTETSGMALSPDGSVLAVAISWDDQVLLVDTATRTELARITLPSGSFPLKVAFAPDGARAYAINSRGHSVSVIDVAGSSSSLVTTIDDIGLPSSVAVDAAGEFLYVGGFAADSGVYVIDASTNSLVGTVGLSGARARAMHYSPLDSMLYVAATGPNALYRVSAAGLSSAVVDSVPLTSSPASLVFSESRRIAIAAQPIVDGVDLVPFSPLSQIDLTIVTQPSPTGDHGQVPVLPASADWVHEWQSFWVELWGSTPETTGLGITEAVVDLNYDSNYLTAQEIVHGPAFTVEPTGTIDDAAGQVRAIGGRTGADQQVGDEGYVLLARIRFASTGDDQVPVDQAGRFIGPYDMQFGLSNGLTQLADVQPMVPGLGGSPGTELWAVMYDIEDNDRIDFGDLSHFAAAFGRTVGESASEPPFVWWADFDKSNRVDFGDLAFFAPNFGTSREGVQSGSETLVFPSSFPSSWSGQSGPDPLGEAEGFAVQELAPAGHPVISVPNSWSLGDPQRQRGESAPTLTAGSQVLDVQNPSFEAHWNTPLPANRPIFAEYEPLRRWSEPQDPLEELLGMDPVGGGSVVSRW